MRTLILLAFSTTLFAQSPVPLISGVAGAFAIWPGKAPGKANGASVIIAPEGAFRFLMVDYEGVDMARWLVDRGVTAFVLRYRVMRTPEDEAAMTTYLQDLMRAINAGDTKSESPPNHDAATSAALALAEEDGRQAIRYVRDHAAEWSLDPSRIGIAGFSAGGGVVMGPVMQHDAKSRPDFAAPIYPAYRSAVPVPGDGPPLFIVTADDDRLISPNSSARLYTSWHAAAKPAELHVFRRGGHGFGMRTLNAPTDQWIRLFYAWMDQSGVLKPAAQPISRLYVFGDSYSDTGAGYVDGDGPTAVGYLATRLGLTLRVPSSPDANSQSLNFAVSGAQTGRGAGRKVQDALLGRGMVEQVDDFAARVQSKQLTFDSARPLFFLAGGLNDRRLPGAETVGNLKGHIRKLYGLGARRFRLALLPTAIPSFSEVGIRLNPELQRIPGEIAAELPGATIQLSNWGPFFDEVMRYPSANGIENTKDACAGRKIFNEDATPCAKPSAYFYYHAGHPSTAVHRIVGDKLYYEIGASR